MPGGISSAEFDSLEVADIRRIASESIGTPTPGGKGQVSGVAETRKSFDSQQAVKIKAVKPKRDTPEDIKKAIEGGLPKDPPTWRFVNTDTRGKLFARQATSALRFRGRAIGAAGAGLVVSALVPDPIASIAGAAAAGFATAGPAGAAVAAAAATIREVAAFKLARTAEELEAITRARGFRAFSELREDAGFFSWRRLHLEKQFLEGRVAGFERIYRVGGLAALVAKSFRDLSFVPKIEGIPSIKDITNGVARFFEWVGGVDKIRLQREEDIANWQARPANSHPTAIGTIDDMQRNFLAQLATGTNLDSALGRKKPETSGDG